jgi:hypothetical protein
MMFLNLPLHIKFILWYQLYIVSKFFLTIAFEVLEWSAKFERTNNDIIVTYKTTSIKVNPN